ncbi:hypothetical protein KP509_09G004600 [Ceratopteris richardii]|uniref:Uncharacterized protein n=1 Tax=Ceratopteris richardii TaxID=49495 RepID=A0A8T2U4S7_CERRI|nr:hypothetical protein KP509_09G004600 [Ceratopteris richardii]KAH7428503.1 hypothetical protein KP509_09G004600 [Ceratopteris richardii]KAH7428504.1 hypothetical protein KP509_09G004600 [Ceratopteris richardii]
MRMAEMAGQKDVPEENSVLSDGVAQEFEHGKLVEENTSYQIVLKQTSPGSSSNRLSRKLTRRSSSLENSNSCEKDLVDCQKKLIDCQQENTKLNEELLGVSLLKNKLADLLKRENEEKVRLEKQQNFFQNQVLAASFERDQLMSEVDKFHRKEEEMSESIAELQERLHETKSKYSEEKNSRTELQDELERLKHEVILYRKVVDKFWNVRAQATQEQESEKNEERSMILLQEDEGFWSYGDQNKIYHDQVTKAQEDVVVLQRELDACQNSLVICQREKLEESNARKHSETAFLDCKMQLIALANKVDSELEQLSLIKASLKEEMSAFFLEQMKEILSLQEALQNTFAQEKGITEDKPDFRTAGGSLNESRDIDIDTTCNFEDPMEEETSIDENADYIQASNDDNKAALAQALQEKVAALLLLSQQEERHLVESNAVVRLESEISSLKQQLFQVTNEKVDALMELAQVHGKLHKLQDTSKDTLSNGQLSSIEDHHLFCMVDKNPTSPDSTKRASMQGYWKHLWLKGPELGLRTKSLSHMLTLRSSKETDPDCLSRLRAENATLREAITNIRHLCKASNRLRLTIARVAADSNVQTESSIQAAAKSVDGVISEALHLKVSLHNSLPVDDLEWNSIGSPLARASEANPDSSDYDANDDLHIVSFFGLEVLRLVLLAAQLQKRCLGQNLV